MMPSVGLSNWSVATSPCFLHLRFELSVDCEEENLFGTDLKTNLNLYDKMIISNDQIHSNRGRVLCTNLEILGVLH